MPIKYKTSAKDFFARFKELWGKKHVGMKIKELVLHTASFESLKEFYASLLELPIEIINAESFAVQAGVSRLVFLRALPGIEPVYHFAFNIPSNKIEDARAWLLRRVKLLWLADYNSDIAEFAGWHARSVYFLDPSGNIVEFISRFDLNDPVEEAFSAMHIRNISEVGMVFPENDFEKDINELIVKYGLGYFSKQAPLPKFRAIGNDEGLFVIVPEGRIWFSTKDTRAGIFPLKVLFEEGERMLDTGY